MKSRRHHNNKGSKQIKHGSSSRKLQHFALRLAIPFKAKNSGEKPK